MNQVELIGLQADGVGNVVGAGETEVGIEGRELPPFAHERLVLWHGLPVYLLRSFMGRYSRFEREQYRGVRFLLRVAGNGRVFESAAGGSTAEQDEQTLLDFAYGLDDDIGQLAAVLSSSAASVEVAAVLREFELSNDDGRGMNRNVETLMVRTYAMLVDFQAALSVLVAVLAHRGVDVSGLYRRSAYVSSADNQPAYPFALGDEPYIVPMGRMGEVSYGAMTADVVNDLQGADLSQLGAPSCPVCVRRTEAEQSAMVRAVAQAQKHVELEREYPRPEPSAK